MLNRALQTFIPRGANGKPQWVRVQRFKVSSYGTNGELVEQAPDVLSIEAVIVPVTGDDMKFLPEGMDASETRRVLTEKELFTSDGREPDVILLDGLFYTVFNAKRWPGIPPDPPFFDCLVSRNQKTEP